MCKKLKSTAFSYYELYTSVIYKNKHTLQLVHFQDVTTGSGNASHDQREIVAEVEVLSPSQEAEEEEQESKPDGEVTYQHSLTLDGSVLDGTYQHSLTLDETYHFLQAHVEMVPLQEVSSSKVSL